MCYCLDSFTATSDIFYYKIICFRPEYKCWFFAHSSIFVHEMFMVMKLLEFRNEEKDMFC